MKESALYLIGAIALVAFKPSTPLTQTTANDVCTLLQNGYSIVGDNGCNEFYTCSNGVASLNSCVSGFKFSKESQSCVPASYVSCNSADKTPCDSIADGTFVSVPSSCTEFYYCNGGIGTLGSCPGGMNFDAAQQSCNYTSSYPCSITSADELDGSINLCAVVPSEVFFGSSSSCRAWQKCASGALSVGVCPEPYYFNVNTGACDWQDNCSCRQLNGDPSTGNSADYLNGQSCSSNGLIVSDNLTCAGYYTCLNNVYNYATCQNGLYFNPPTKTCVNRLNAINNCNRCENTKLVFVNLYQDNCAGYGYCKNGRLVSTADCPSGYFSEVSEACIVDGTEPLFPVCNNALASIATTPGSTLASTASTTSNTTTGGTTSEGTTADGSTSEGTTSDSSTSEGTTSESTTSESTTDLSSTTGGSSTT